MYLVRKACANRRQCFRGLYCELLRSGEMTVSPKPEQSRSIIPRMRGILLLALMIKEITVSPRLLTEDADTAAFFDCRRQRPVGRKGGLPTVIIFPEIEIFFPEIRVGTGDQKRITLLVQCRMMGTSPTGKACRLHSLPIGSTVRTAACPAVKSRAGAAEKSCPFGVLSGLRKNVFVFFYYNRRCGIITSIIWSGML